MRLVIEQKSRNRTRKQGKRVVLTWIACNSSTSVLPMQEDEFDALKNSEWMGKRIGTYLYQGRLSRRGRPP